MGHRDPAGAAGVAQGYEITLDFRSGQHAAGFGSLWLGRVGTLAEAEAVVVNPRALLAAPYKRGQWVVARQGGRVKAFGVIERASRDLKVAPVTERSFASKVARAFTPLAKVIEANPDGWWSECRNGPTMIDLVLTFDMLSPPDARALLREPLADLAPRITGQRGLVEKALAVSDPTSGAGVLLVEARALQMEVTRLGRRFDADRRAKFVEQGVAQTSSAASSSERTVKSQWPWPVDHHVVQCLKTFLELSADLASGSSNGITYGSRAAACWSVAGMARAGGSDDWKPGAYSEAEGHYADMVRRVITGAPEALWGVALSYKS